MNRSLALCLLAAGVLAACDSPAQPRGGTTDVSQPVKTARTFFTEERIGSERRSYRDSVARADAYLEENSLADLWRFVPGQALPRSYSIHSRESSHRFPSPEPWTVRVEIEGEERLMPSNDFGAYYESGLNEQGWFDPELADRDLLVNERHPEKPEDWGVDDGWGWEDDDGTHWTFIAHYLHWHRFVEVRNRVVHFRNAYLYTEDPVYARAGLVFLDRLADIYPDLDISVHGTELFNNSTGGTHTGKMIGRFWEANRIRDIMSGYDAFFPLVSRGDEELVRFLSGKADRYSIGDEKRSIEGVARNIEDNILREILPAVKGAQVRGDYGNLGALAMAAVVLDEPDGYTGEVLAFIMRSGGLERIDGEWRTTGGGVLPYLVNQVDRDGHADRGAPQYNRIYAGRMARAAGILGGYDAPPELNLAAHPKYLRLRDSQRALSMLDRYVPPIGDSYLTGNPVRYAHSPSPEASANLAGYGFAALRDGVRDADQWPDNRRAAWVHYGRNAIRDADGNRIAGGHAHRNALTLGLYGFGLDLAPDLGYPEQTGSWPKRINWTANTVSHNTVVVNARRQEGHWVGIPRGFEASETVRFIDVEAPIVYPEIDTYRRMTAMIRIDDDHSYLVDLFRVAGGEDHLFSFHGAEGPVETAGLDLVPQASGTYAGEDVPLPGHGEDTAYNREVRNGFNYLYDVRRAVRPDGGFSVEWQVTDSWDVLPEASREGIRLRLTMLNHDLDELAVAHGDPPQRTGSDNPRRLNYVLARRQGNDLETTFTSVIEPYRDERRIHAIEPMEVRRQGAAESAPDTEARAVRVTLANGSVDYFFHSVNPEQAYEIGDAYVFSGSVGFVRENDEGVPVDSYLYQGTRLQHLGSGGPGLRMERPHIDARVVDFTREMQLENHIWVEFEEASSLVEDLPGRWIYVETDGWRNGAYKILEAEAENGNRVRLDLGNTTLIRRFVDSHDFDRGYEYNIAADAEAIIPLSRAYRRE